jgi:hypothetical protein
LAKNKGTSVLQACLQISWAPGGRKGWTRNVPMRKPRLPGREGSHNNSFYYRDRPERLDRPVNYSIGQVLVKSSTYFQLRICFIRFQNSKPSNTTTLYSPNSSKDGVYVNKPTNRSPKNAEPYILSSNDGLGLPGGFGIRLAKNLGGFFCH